jgi:hypothetical protein
MNDRQWERDKNFAAANSLGFWRKNICAPEILFLERPIRRGKQRFRAEALRARRKAVFFLFSALSAPPRESFHFQPFSEGGKIYVESGATLKNLALHQQTSFR